MEECLRASLAAAASRSDSGGGRGLEIGRCGQRHQMVVPLSMPVDYIIKFERDTLACLT